MYLTTKVYYLPIKVQSLDLFNCPTNFPSSPLLLSPIVIVSVEPQLKEIACCLALKCPNQLKIMRPSCPLSCGVYFLPMKPMTPINRSSRAEIRWLACVACSHCKEEAWFSCQASTSRIRLLRIWSRELFVELVEERWPVLVYGRLGPCFIRKAICVCWLLEN